MTKQELDYFLTPLDKNLEKVQDIRFMWAMSSTTIYEKAVLTQLILNAEPQTSREIAFNTGVSESSVKRAVKSLKQAGIVINHPRVDGIILDEKRLF